MFGKRRGNIKALFALGAALFIALAMACGGETIREVIVTQEVIKEVIKEVVVPGETIIKEVPVEVIVTQEVIKEVIKEVLVPGETIIKEVIKEVVVVQEVVKEIFTEVPFEKIVLKEIPQAPGITADNPP